MILTVGHRVNKCNLDQRCNRDTHWSTDDDQVVNLQNKRISWKKKKPGLMRIEQIFKASNNIFRHNILNSDISFKLTFLLFLPPPSCSSLPLLYYLIYLTFFLFCLLDFAGLESFDLNSFDSEPWRQCSFKQRKSFIPHNLHKKKHPWTLENKSLTDVDTTYFQHSDHIKSTEA